MRVTSDRVLWLIRSEMKMFWNLHHDVTCVTDWQQTKSNYCLTGMEKSRIKATLNWLDDVKSSEEFRDATAQMIPTVHDSLSYTQTSHSLSDHSERGNGMVMVHTTIKMSSFTHCCFFVFVFCPFQSLTATSHDMKKSSFSILKNNSFCWSRIRMSKIFYPFIKKILFLLISLHLYSHLYMQFSRCVFVQSKVHSQQLQSLLSNWCFS